MGPKKHNGLQTDAVAITLSTANEQARDKNGRFLKVWLDTQGEPWHRLPRYRRQVGASGHSFYIGPRCRHGHDGFGLGGAVRRISNHGCVECQLFRSVRNH